MFKKLSDTFKVFCFIGLVYGVCLVSAVYWYNCYRYTPSGYMYKNLHIAVYNVRHNAIADYRN